ncbi:hypothetical protein KSP40_PGU020354 [Platanthera guangdongensis]|uniref:VHS domain-containing protein n=1 Tax=Platanthera guangdongensis TaxID=2320717 RepID=A0ABR2M3H9_9ASPA
MPNALVDRATSDMLIGPDWAMNLEICGILNHDPGCNVYGHFQLLEVVVRNCGDMVHMHIANKDVPRAMGKIAKKKVRYGSLELLLNLYFPLQAQETLGDVAA